MAKKKIIKRAKKAILIVGEGPQEEIFLKHLKSQFDRSRKQVIKIESADGGSPKSIIDYVVRQKHVQYDNRYILMDSDIPPSQSDLSYAKKNGIIIFLSEPICLDGMLLKLLSKPIPMTNQECKKELKKLLNGPATSIDSYKELFHEKFLTSTNNDTLNTIIRILQNKKIN